MKIKRLAIEISNKAFLPEAAAYRKFFMSKGLQCDFVNKGTSDFLSYDAVVLFHGLHPFWKKYPELIIGEYHTLSTGKFSRLKDIVKRVLNVRPSLYIFLNEEVRRKLWLSDKCHYITRTMGFDNDLVNEYLNETKIYDVVYAGSLREGLIPVINQLAALGLKVAVVGFEYPFASDNVFCFGRQTIPNTYKLVAQSRVGLNFTPDVFPLNIQDSTKVIEYCAAGLGVLTNSYKWVNDFSLQREARFQKLNEVKSKADVIDFNYIVPDVRDLAWDRLAAEVYEKINKL